MRRIGLTCLLILVMVISAFGSEWHGYWGGGFEELERAFPGISFIERGVWDGGVICWAFSDEGNRPWTESEKTVAFAAISQWNFVSSGLQELIVPIVQPSGTVTGECLGQSVNVELRWGNPVNDLVGIYAPYQLAQPIQDQIGDICLLHNLSSPCSIIILKSDHSWFVDSTPTIDEEFQGVSRSFCGSAARTYLEAIPDRQAAGKQDLFTVIGHEFGHALGLIHSGGCDNNVLTNEAITDDDGNLLWGGKLLGRRGAGATEEIGFNERRRVDADAERRLAEVYGSIDRSRDCVFKTDPWDEKALSPVCDSALDFQFADVVFEESGFLGPQLSMTTELQTELLPDGVLKEIPPVLYQFDFDVDNDSNTGLVTNYFPPDLGVDLEVLVIYFSEPRVEFVEIVRVWDPQNESFQEFESLAQFEFGEDTSQLQIILPTDFLNQTLDFYSQMRIGATPINWIAVNWTEPSPGERFVADYYPDYRFRTVGE